MVTAQLLVYSSQSFRTHPPRCVGVIALNILHSLRLG